MCVCDRIECQLNMVVSKRKWYISITLFHSFSLCVFRVGVRADFMWFDIVVAGYASVISYGWKLNWPLWKKICSNNNKDHGQIMMTTAKWMVRMAIKLESSIRWSINFGLSFVHSFDFYVEVWGFDLCYRPNLQRIVHTNILNILLKSDRKFTMKIIFRSDYSHFLSTSSLKGHSTKSPSNFDSMALTTVDMLSTRQKAVKLLIYLLSS